MTDVLPSAKREHRSERPRKRVKGLIYVLVNPTFGKTGAVKFGHSNVGSARPRSQLSPGIEFHCAIDGTEAQEKRLQRYFAKHQIAPNEIGGQKEWFWLRPEVAYYIDYLGQQSFVAPSLEEMDNPDGVSAHDRRFPWQDWREPARNGDGAQQFLPLGPLFLAPGVRKAKSVTERQEGFLSSETDDWYTPSLYIEAVHEVMGGIDLDPASCRTANFRVRAEHIFTRQDDGLAQQWNADRVYLNPPYGEEARNFTSTLMREMEQGRVREAIVCLNANSVTSHWFQPLWAHTLCFIRGRVDFVVGTGRPEVGSASTHGTVFVYLGPNRDLFAKVFSRFGPVVTSVVPAS